MKIVTITKAMIRALLTDTPQSILEIADQQGCTEYPIRILLIELKADGYADFKMEKSERGHMRQMWFLCGEPQIIEVEPAFIKSDMSKILDGNLFARV
jgi:predicted ArsR family transcriptional regulator